MIHETKTVPPPLLCTYKQNWFLHKFYTIAKDFQITLDSHFISSKILYKYYNSPGNRVVRCSLPHEKSHQDYYSKFEFNNVEKNLEFYGPVDRDKVLIKLKEKDFSQKKLSRLCWIKALS